MTLEEMQIRCDAAMRKLERLFQPNCKLTLLIRSPDLDDGDIVFSKDNLDEVISAIKRLKDREPCGLTPTETQGN